jgi:hypothetical protein
MRHLVDAHGFEGAIAALPADLMAYIESRSSDIDGKVNAAIQMALVSVVVFVLLDCAFRA